MEQALKQKVSWSRLKQKYFLIIVPWGLSTVCEQAMNRLSCQGDHLHESSISIKLNGLENYFN